MKKYSPFLNSFFSDSQKKIYLIILTLLVSSCLKKDAITPDSDAIRISQFERAGYSDFIVDQGGNFHAVFLESPDIGKPIFVYYSTSTNKGKSWSKPVSISNDLTGNGCAYPRIIRDAGGNIYAIWKRYGNYNNGGATTPVTDVILEGLGGYTVGTLYYAILNGGTFSKPIRLAEFESTQISWFPALDRNGKVRVFWSQISNESLKNYWNTWYFADWIREAELTPNGIANVLNYTTPSKPDYAGGAPPKFGWQNLRGYFDTQNKPHFLWEAMLDNQKVIAYFNGVTAVQNIYKYPLYKEGNTFNNPAALLVDESGNDHVVFVPSASTLESEQIWDYNIKTQKTTILASIQKKGITIQGFQGYQGPNGEMSVSLQIGGNTGSNESYGLFYKNNSWSSVGLTENASKESLATTDFKNFNNKSSYLNQLTLYNTKFIKIAWDNAGNKSMLMTLSADWLAGGYRVNSPSIMFEKID